MLGIVGKTNHDPIEHGVDSLNFADAPTFMFAVVTRVQGEQRVGLGNGSGQRGMRIGKLGGAENRGQARVGCVNLAIGGEELGTEILVGQVRLGLEFEGVEPLVMLASGFKPGGEKRRQFGGDSRLAGVGEFFDEHEQEFGLVR